MKTTDTEGEIPALVAAAMSGSHEYSVQQLKLFTGVDGNNNLPGTQAKNGKVTKDSQIVPAAANSSKKSLVVEDKSLLHSSVTMRNVLPQQAANVPRISNPKTLLYRETATSPFLKAQAAYQVKAQLLHESSADGLKSQIKKQHHPTQQIKNLQSSSPSLLLSSTQGQDSNLYSNSPLRLKQATKKKPKQKDTKSTLLMGATFNSFAHASGGMVNINSVSVHGHYASPLDTTKRTVSFPLLIST